jgi:hypothetical protein
VEGVTVPRLFMLTVPGLKVASDWRTIHDRLLDEFAGITDVLATTMSATLLIVYEGDAYVDAWLEGISDGILSRRPSAGHAPRVRTQSRARGYRRTWELGRARDRPAAPSGPYPLEHATQQTKGAT